MVWKAEAWSDMRWNETSYPLCYFNTNQVIQVLEGVIKYRWNALPIDQQEGIKNSISDVIV